jgi:hypothetical protein
MSHVVRKLTWCEIDLDTKTGAVFIQLRWQYVWAVAAGQSAWTLPQKRHFHNSADRAIWASWSNRAALSVAGTSSFARAFASRPVSVELDIRWVTHTPHWTVTVTKIAAGTVATSSVQWTARTITLDSEDVVPRERCIPAAGPPSTPGGPTPVACFKQIPVAHEFGHAAGNTAVLSRGDEYGTGHVHEADATSMLNIGTQLRDRHFTTIIDELNTMIPNTTFSVGRIRT